MSIREITAGSDVSGLVEICLEVQVVEHRVLLLSFVNGATFFAQKPVYCQLIYESGQLYIVTINLLTVTITRIACTQLLAMVRATTLAHRTNLITCELVRSRLVNRSSVVLPLVFTCILPATWK
ncbi:hypothetical protein SPFM20_00101 [Salmonella phage SPFM20]|nr:hypothetical protein SPFM20_00101 [Salmonella phage SPFM20]